MGVNLDAQTNHNENTSQPPLRGVDRLKTDKRAQLYQKIVIGWLVLYLALRLINLIWFSSAYTNAGASTSFIAGIWILVFILLIPAIIVLIGIFKVKVWAYWLYIVALFFSLSPSGNIEGTANAIIYGVGILGSLIVLVITIMLYYRIFPSKKK